MENNHGFDNNTYHDNHCEGPYCRCDERKDEKPLGVVDAYVKENTTELVDPLEVQKKLNALEEKRNTLLRELDTQIKVSNATTFIEIM